MSSNQINLSWSPCVNNMIGGPARGVAYNDTSGLWVVVGEDSNNNNIKYSYNPDISGWITCDYIANNPYFNLGTGGSGVKGVAYNNAIGLWLAVGNSTDGQNILGNLEIGRASCRERV
jgi:hypothetical protein